MGNRIIKESVCVSEQIDELDWFEEVFFYRLLVNADRQDRTEIPLPRETGMAKYLKYLGVLTAIYLAGYIALDCISFRPAHFILLKFAASWAAAMAAALLLVLPLQNRKL